MRTLACLPLLLANLFAQDEATTLARLCDRSAAVAIVRPTTTGEVADGRRTVRVTVVRVLSGTPPAALDLHEPDGRSCGRALAGVAAGAGYVAFLQSQAGSWRLAATTARALPALEPALLAHVSALLADPSPKARRAELVRALASASERVRDDAAHALSCLPTLAGMTPAEREACAAALVAALPRDDSTSIALLVVASRAKLVEAIERVVLLELGGSLGRTAAAAIRCVAEVDADATAQALGVHLPRDPAGRDRALLVLDHLQCPRARASLEEIAQEGNAEQACRAAELMLRIGIEEQEVARAVGAAVAAEAARSRDRQRDARPRYRFVHPENAR